MYPHRPSAARGLALSVGAALLLGTALTPVAGAAKTPTTKSAAAAKAAGKKKSKKKPAKKKPASNRKPRQAKQLGSGDGYRAVAALAPYAGPTGAILHTKSFTTRFKIDDDPQSEPGFNDQAERWVELGGGDRSRELRTWFDYDGKVDSTQENWREPRFWALVSSGIPASVAIWCTPNPSGTSEQGVLDRLGAADLASLPSGPVIAGVATKVLAIPVDVGAPIPGKAPVFHYYLNATTKIPVRSTYTPYESDRPLGQTDYSLWEVQPAGGSAAALAGTLPLDADLGQGVGVRPGCVGS